MTRTIMKSTHSKNVKKIVKKTIAKKTIKSPAKKTIATTPPKYKEPETNNNTSKEITKSSINTTKSPVKNISIKLNKIDAVNKSNTTTTQSPANPNKTNTSTPKNNTMNKSRRKSQPKQLFKLKHSHIHRTFTLNTNIYKEIRRLQHSTDNLLPKSPFLRLVKEILYQFCSSDMRIQRVALLALQESCELYMTQFFEDSYLATLHAKRVTLYPEDMRLVRRLRGVSEICNR